VEVIEVAELIVVRSIAIAAIIATELDGLASLAWLLMG